MLIPFEILFRKYNINPNGILHIGANTGQEAEAYDKLGVKNVIWVEAIPDVYLKLRSHISKYPGHIAIEACVSDKDGETVEFNIANNEGQSSSFLELGTHKQEHPTVKYINQIALQTIRVDTLLQQNNLTLSDGWLLNIDLQGAELLALKGMGNLIDFFDYAYLEVNQKELYKGCPLIQDIDLFMGIKGFDRKETKMTGNGWGDALYSRPCSRQ